MKYLTIGLLLFITVSEICAQQSLVPKKKGGSRDKKPKKPPHSKRIIEGIMVNHADYPFIVSLLYYGTHVCGGSVISDKVILTAAHCCFDPLEMHFNPQSLQVAVGSSKWKTARKLKVSKIVTHEKYDPDKVINDVAIWVLKDKLKKSDNVAVVKLSNTPVNEDLNQVYATVLGWGFTSEQGLLVQEASEDLYMVTIYSVPLSECKKHYAYIGNGHICFSSPDRRGSCNGDSGGPLVMKQNNQLVQIGLVSYGSDCNNTKPEVYTRISAQYPWIKNNVIKARRKNW